MDGEKFLQDTIQMGEGTIIIMATAHHIRLLGEAKIWIVDGTFSTVPNGFAQIFTIHGSVGDGESRRFVPFVYALLPKKNETTYTAAFTALIKAAENIEVELEPETILADFELAEINAVKACWPDSEVHGCYFHFSQSMFRKLKQLHLQKSYGNDNTVHLTFKKILALAFLPPQDIPTVFNKLKKSTPRNMVQFMKYVGEFYIHGPVGKKRGPTFPPKLWSVHNNIMNGVPRTSNNLEGWHNKWNSLFKNKVSFYGVLRQFQLEERSASTQVIRTLQLEPTRKKNEGIRRKRT